MAFKVLRCKGKSSDLRIAFKRNKIGFHILDSNGRSYAVTKHIRKIDKDRLSNNTRIDVMHNMLNNISKLNKRAGEVLILSEPNVVRDHDTRVASLCHVIIKLF